MDKYTATEQAYKHGYEKGYAKAKAEIVYCKDCIHREYLDMGDDIGAIGGCGLFGSPMMTCDDFCSYGERGMADGSKQQG